MAHDAASAPRSQAERGARTAGELRRTIRFRMELSQDELLDAAEDVEQLLFDSEELDLSPPGRDLLFALDEAMADAPTWAHDGPPPAEERAVRGRGSRG